MKTVIIEVKSKRNLKRFIHLPAKIHKGHQNWVPPVYMDERIFFNPKKNSAFAYSDTILFLAINNGKPVGRIMGIINHKYNQEHHEKYGRFCFLETYEDQELANQLLTKVELWAKSKGMEELIGPFGFSDKDPQGLLVEGFDQPIVISTNCNFPYLVDFVEGFGFTKKIDLVVYKVDVPEKIPDFYQKIYERSIRNNPEIRLVTLEKRRDIKAYIRPVLSLMNETFKKIYGFTPLTIKEMDEFASRYMMILDPRFIKIIENKKNEVIAFFLGIPDISIGIQKSKGYVLPFGLIQILKSQKKTNCLSLLLGGIREDYRNHGLDTILGVNMIKDAQKAGLKYIDSHLEMESHLKMRSEMERMGGIVYKRYRIYRKSI